MDLAHTGTWFLLIQLAAFIPARAIASGDHLHVLDNAPNSAKSSTTLQATDIALPQRTTTNTTSLVSNNFLTFTQRSQEREIRYNLTAFEKEFHFVLEPEKRFLAPSFTIEHITGNQSKSIPSGSDLSHCFYRGRVYNDSASSAVFDLCNGMRGAFKTREGVYLIQPLVQRNPGVDDTGSYSRRHVVTDHLATISQPSGNSHCGLDEESLANRTRNETKTPNLHSLPGLESEVHHRSRREVIFQGAQSYPRYVEVMFTADKSMLDHYGSEFELKRYIQTIMGVVHSIFLDPKIGNSIEIVLTGIKILTNDEDLKITSDARKSLRNFCVWQYKQNVKSDSDAGHYDTAVLITRKDICRTKGNCETLGLAELGTMCDMARSCSIVEDNGLGVAFTVAHELGHIFNIGHDAIAKKCLGENNGLHVMAPAVNLQAMPWSWSSCSRQEITEFLERGDDRCLMDKPQYQFKKSDKLPGEIYSPAKQCKLTYGKDSSLCRFKTKSCRRLWCAVKFPNGREGCRTHAMPWAEGSFCGEGKWCFRGECVPKEVKTKVDGAWSLWSSFGPCSRTCGGGVTFSSRFCNNPNPSNGGKFCLGAKKRFKSCQTQECPKGSASFRAVQCAAYNNKKGPKGSKWVPRYLKGRHRCKLLCERVGGGGFITAKVTDGTKCGKDLFDICVNGICRLAGCDNVLNSRTKVDICGVCGGYNDTCERTYKSWHKKVEWGYNDVTTFLPGFSSIRIEQTTPEAEAEMEVEAKRHRRHRVGDDNYLVLLNERYGNILNSGFYIKSESRITFDTAGLKITYSGSRSYPEYIEIKGKLKQKIHLQVLSVEKVETPKITYSYLRPVEKPDTFVWDNKGPWSRCSLECQGWRRRRLVCKRERDGLVVSTGRCDQNNKPETIKENCNTQCLFKWMVSSKGACQPGCGPGTQRIYFRCVKHAIKSGANLVQPNKDCKLVTKPPTERPCEGTCDNVLWVYSRWSECSKSCDGGVQLRRITCVEKNSDARKELPESMCSKIEKRPVIRACNTLRCPTWRTGRWSRCSSACGEGYQRRKVACYWKGNRAAEAEACGLKTKPKERQNCRIKACPHWEYEEWSDCSTTCGSGQQIRLVRCTGDGETLKDDDCVSDEKPISQRACRELPDCDKTIFFIAKVATQEPGKWVTRNWGECSVECGEGRQEREVSCVDSIKEVVISNELCKNVSKPSTVRQCVQQCGKWKYSSWSACSSKCGDGVQKRRVSCVDHKDNVIRHEKCKTTAKPSAVRDCVQQCGRWKSSSWSACSSECGEGSQKRHISCVDPKENVISDEKCKTISKPSSTRKCVQQCGKWKYSSWSACSSECGEGTQERRVSCVDHKDNVIRDEKCKTITKPSTTRKCDQQCSKWKYSSWSACSSECGEGSQERRVSCVDHKDNVIRDEKCKTIPKPSSTRKCDQQCSKWKYSSWSACSSECGEGSQERRVSCVDHKDNVIRDEKCKTITKPSTTRKCDQQCSKWKYSSWSACSSECGEGSQERRVSCVDHKDNVIRDEKCKTIPKPSSTRKCDQQCNKWKYSSWSACSSECGEGSQKRRVSCVDHKDNVISNEKCKTSSKPSSTRKCVQQCGRWKYSSWSACSSECGEGSQVRRVSCVDDKDNVIRDEKCKTIPKPSSTRKCVHQCSKWKYSSWSACSSECGEGSQERRVSCVDHKDNVISDEKCKTISKPSSTRKCIQQCGKWKYSSWSACSSECGEGTQERRVICVDDKDNVIRDEKCKTISKPSSTRKCVQQCGKWKYSSWSACSSECGEGAQERRVICVDLEDNVISDKKCKIIPKPSSTRKCINYCGIWRYSVWTACSPKCGKGTQRRQVKCFDRKYRLARDEICDPSQRPVNIRQCANHHCASAQKLQPKTSGHWKSGSWNKCSRTCGQGYRRRSVVCIDESSKENISEKICDKKTKPESVLSCNLGTCPFWQVEQWSECSRTCGFGYKRRSVSCVYGTSKTTHVDKISCEKNVKPGTIAKCNRGDCPQWRATHWSKCSKTCGLGMVSRNVYCSNSTDVLSHENCNKKLKPSAMKSCYTKSCLPSVRWVKGKWNPCSAKCGKGLKQREVRCEDVYGKRVAPSRCRHLRRKPRAEKTCRRSTCGVWESGLWGECSSKCGPGTNERSVRCRRDSLFVGDKSCSNEVKPDQEKSCNLKKCEPQIDRYKWFPTSFSACSTTCGAGVQSRMVICVDENEDQVPSRNCNSENKPPKLITCKHRDCLPKWIVGHWSECSKPCNEGVQTRTVSCPEKDEQSSDLCDKDTKPSLERRCNRGPCNSFYTWKTGPWSKCATTCGQATMRRAVKCLGRNNQYSTKESCLKEGIIKPDDTRECFLPKCEPRSCKDVQIQLGRQEDTEFNITIGYKKVQVYCRGMLTNNPKEYITLKSGPQHNFAEYYHRSLKNPSKCPYNGARNNDCPLCHRELFPSSGGTYFSKVRFDVSRMLIIGGDFTFAVTRGNHSPSYGTAGDCYSKAQCPQGRFSIDLTDTGISVASEVTWKSYGYHLSRVITIKEGRQVVTGMCGGYCGVCRPYRTLRVAL